MIETPIPAVDEVRSARRTYTRLPVAILFACMGCGSAGEGSASEGRDVGLQDQDSSEAEEPQDVTAGDGVQVQDTSQGAATTTCPPCVPPPSDDCVGSGPCGCGPYTCGEQADRLDEPVEAEDAGLMCPPCVPPPSDDCVGSGPCGCGPYTCGDPADAGVDEDDDEDPALCPPCVPPPSPECVGSGPCGCGPYTCPDGSGGPTP